MSSVALFEKVVSGELTARQAAEIIEESDVKAKSDRRPSWMPVWVWTAAYAVAVAVLANLGLRRNA
jgi:hypothetical protein